MSSVDRLFGLLVVWMVGFAFVLPDFLEAQLSFLGSARAQATESNLPVREDSSTPALSRSSSQRQPTRSVFGSSASSKEAIWVMRSDEGLSCEPDSGLSLDQGALPLKKAQISILSQKKGTDGKMHTQVCGALRGTTNCYLIPQTRLKQALGLGFERMDP
ncbi:MAG: hypothetical protein ACO3A2_01220 [Bdellovibrionia bacterium]